MRRTTIRQSYLTTLLSYIFALICGIGGSIIMVLYGNRFVESFGEILGIFFLTVVVGSFIALIIISIITLVKLLKDLKSLKNNDYISIIGRVIRFKKNLEPESGVQINDKPIVLILSSNEEVALIINDKIMVGETYKFNYLKNCKIAEVIEKV